MKQIGLIVGLLASVALMAAPGQAICVGDCDTDGIVTWRELVLAGDRGVGKQRNCPLADGNGDGRVFVEEVVQAASNLSAGCAGAPTRTPTPTRTNAPTSTPTSSPTQSSPGPRITYLGLARADNGLIAPDPISAPDGTPIYTRLIGAAFFIVVEALPGSSGFSVGTRTTTTQESPRPDLQIQVNRDLGNGSPVVCDVGPLPEFQLGGVPGISPPSYDGDSQFVTDALIDFGCRFTNNTGEWCTLDAGENPAPVTTGDVSGLVQFCTTGVLGAALHFPSGDTLLTARVRDCSDTECTVSNLGSPARIIVRTP